MNKTPYNQSGVYLLFKGDELVYVGKSINLFSRISTHTQSKRFDSFWFINCPKETMDESERKLIDLLQPPENKQGISFHRARTKYEQRRNELIKQYDEYCDEFKQDYTPLFADWFWERLPPPPEEIRTAYDAIKTARYVVVNEFVCNIKYEIYKQKEGIA